jgi:thymidylate synthase (FAD)
MELLGLGYTTVDLRTSNGTQKEHAQIAAQVQDILYSQIPNVCEAMWNKNLD